MTRRTALLFIWLAVGCASAGPNRPTAVRERDVLRTQEILDSPHARSDLYRAIQSLRPQFLAPPRGVNSAASGSSSPTEVYVDGRRQIGLEALRTLPASAIAEVRYLDPVASINELGPRASGGALMVKLLKDGTP